MQEEAGKPALSIIVTTYSLNRFDDTASLLDSINTQARPYVETMIITEKVPELTDKLKQYIAEKNYTGMQVVFNSGEAGLSAARNLGVAHARGNIIAFVDDDALLCPGWVEETLKTYDDFSIIGATGPVLPLWEQESMGWFPREFYWIFSCTGRDTDKLIEVRNGYGTNISFRREAFTAAGGFRTNLGCKGRGTGGWQEPGSEELDFSLRAKRLTGKRIVFNPAIKVQHRVYGYRLKTSFIARRAYWEGYVKALLKHWHHREGNEKVLSEEYGLLRRILFHLLPGIFIRLFRQPLIALRQLYVTKLILVCVAAGYLKSEISILSGRSDYDAASEQ